MEILVTKDPDKIQRDLYNALDKIIINRIDDGAFTDEDDVKDKRYYFSTLEGLECLLIPLVSLARNRLWEPLQEKHPQLKSIIVDDINFILDYNRGKFQPPKEHGHPYFMEGGRRGQAYWTSECSSFTLSVLSNFLELRRKYGVGQIVSKKDIEQVITMNYEWVRLCKRDKLGWAWVHNSAEHHWPTWSLLDTFEEILWYPSTDSMFNKLQKECYEIIDEIIAKFKDPSPGSYLSLWNEKVVNTIPYDVITALDLSRLMLAVSLYKQHMDIYPLALMLFEWASKSDFSQLKYQYHLRERANYIFDSSLVPSVLRALITMTERLSKRIEQLNEDLKQNNEIVINKVFEKLAESQIGEGKYKGLWGIVNGSGITYELYYTERTIEALTAFLAHYKSTKPIAEILGQKQMGKPKRISAKKRKELEMPPSNIDKYTVWIPQLAEQHLPEDLHNWKHWTIEDLFEFYIFRLFNVMLAVDGKEWGYTVRGEPLPDGLLIIEEGRQVLYDAKATTGSYNITAAEIDKFLRYTKEAKRKALARKKEVQFFLVIANSFSGDLKKRAEKFHAEINMKLVCMCAKDICNFANLIRQKTTNASELALIKWNLLLSKGDPLISETAYEEIRDMFLKDFENL